MERRNRGWFKPGEDSRRHRFTREECRRGYAAAEASIAKRYPGADAHFLMCAMIGSTPWHNLPLIRDLMQSERELTDQEAMQRFGIG